MTLHRSIMYPITSYLILSHIILTPRQRLRFVSPQTVDISQNFPQFMWLNLANLTHLEFNHLTLGISNYRIWMNLTLWHWVDKFLSQQSSCYTVFGLLSMVSICYIQATSYLVQLYTVHSLLKYWLLYFFFSHTSYVYCMRKEQIKQSSNQILAVL